MEKWKVRKTTKFKFFAGNLMLKRTFLKKNDSVKLRFFIQKKQKFNSFTLKNFKGL